VNTIDKTTPKAIMMAAMIANIPFQDSDIVVCNFSGIRGAVAFISLCMFLNANKYPKKMYKLEFKTDFIHIQSYCFLDERIFSLFYY